MSGALYLALALTISPLKSSSFSLQFVTQTLVPPNSTTKRLVGMFTNHILLSTFPVSEAVRLRYIDASRRASSVISRAKSATWQATCSNLSPPLLFPLPMPRPLSPLATLVVPPKPGGPSKRNLQCRNDGGPAPWHTDLRRLRYIDASRRASSVISRGNLASHLF